MAIIYTHAYLWASNYGTACGFLQNIQVRECLIIKILMMIKNYDVGSDFTLPPITNIMHKSKMINVINL
jgi:hypothetical protein